jgi:phosphatidylglycerophosphate synthase
MSEASEVGQAVSERGFWERYRELFNRRGEDFWSVVFGYPVARFFVVLLVPVTWISPSTITLVGFAVKLAAAALLWPDLGVSVWWVALLLQVAQVFDSMDGTLARARPAFSKVGGFLDKVTDGVGLYAIATALGVRAAHETSQWWHLILGSAAGACFLVLCYMYWVVKASAQAQQSAQSMAGGAEPLPWRELGKEWLSGWLRAIRFGEADLYLWIALFAVLDLWAECVYLLVATQGFTLLKRFVDHLQTLAKNP